VETSHPQKDTEPHVRPYADNIPTLPLDTVSAGTDSADKKQRREKKTIQDRLGSRATDSDMVVVGELADHMYQDDKVLGFVERGKKPPSTAAEIKAFHEKRSTLSMELLNKEFGEALCKAPIVHGVKSKGGKKTWLRYCQCPKAQGHAYMGDAHKVEEARTTWQGFSKEKRDSFCYAK